MDIHNHKQSWMGDLRRKRIEIKPKSVPKPAIPAVDQTYTVEDVYPCCGGSFRTYCTGLRTQVQSAKDPNTVVSGSYSRGYLIPTPKGYHELYELLCRSKRFGLIDYSKALVRMLKEDKIHPITYSVLEEVFRGGAARWFNEYLGSNINIEDNFIRKSLALSEVIDRVVDGSSISRNSIMRGLVTLVPRILGTVVTPGSIRTVSVQSKVLRGMATATPGLSKDHGIWYYKLGPTTYKMHESLMVFVNTYKVIGIPEKLDDIIYNAERKHYEIDSLLQSTINAINSLNLRSDAKIVTVDGAVLQLWVSSGPASFGRLTN